MLNIYRASAGSGKTFRLTQDYIHLLFNPKKERTHRRILAVTFTNKATDEMKTRILKELHALSQGEKSAYRQGLMKEFAMSEEAVNDRARKILTTILHDYSSFTISTIDRFFQQVIRSFAREIGVHGGYNLELDSDNTLQQSVDNMFLDLSNSDNKQLLNWLTQFAEERIEQSENWNPRRSIEDLGKEIFKESYQHKAEDTNRRLHDHEFLNSYRKKLNKIKVDFEESVKTTAQKALDLMANYGLSHEDFSYATTKTFDALKNGKYEISKRFVAYADDVTNCYTKTKPQNIKNAIESAYSAGLQAQILEIIRLLQVDIVLFNSANIVLKHISTLGILSDLALQIKKLTDEQNSMLISDSNMLLNKIIDNSETPFVYEKTGIYIDHFMIDEFQDTSTLQWKNFYPLISNSLSSGKLNLVVGDVKQSIYRWRNSDWKLLDEQIMKDFRPEQIHEENLDTNWRSDENIIAFNNEFFKSAAFLLQQKLNENLQPVLALYPDLQTLTERIEHAYGQLEQKTATKAGIGRVNVQFIQREENDEGWRTECLNRLPVILEDLQSRGYMPGDVALLVRTNGEEQQVIRKILNYKTSPEALHGYSYDIMGNEGLLIGTSASVRFILGILRLIVTPTDSIQKTIISFEYARACLNMTENEAINRCFENSHTENSFSSLFTPTENQQLSELKNKSLYEMIENIISLFQIGLWYDQAVFVQAFQDVVFKYTSGKNTDLYSFLKWWDKNGVKQCISTPENKDSFRIMTIHKSKGLDFKVVIIPFCDWDIDKKSGFFKNVLWCEPKQAPFNELAILPVEYSSKLGNSIFAENYFDELMHQYIDNLNVAYVAFTRAKHELICLTPTPKSDPVSTEKINSLSGLMMYSFQNQVNENTLTQLVDNYDKEIMTFNLGIPLQVTKTEKQSEIINEKLSAYPSVSSFNRLTIKHQSLDYWLDNQGMNQSRLNYGIIMHDILRKITKKSDQSNAINAMIREGRINELESQHVIAEMEKFWNLPGINTWFSDDIQVMNEATILTPGGDLYRPDRVVFNDNSATVIDYKFGDFESKTHSAQVKQYMNLIAQMNFEVEGYLCYVSLGKVVAVG